MDVTAVDDSLMIKKSFLKHGTAWHQRFITSAAQPATEKNLFCSRLNKTHRGRNGVGTGEYVTAIHKKN
jgi:hypothetical protein